MSFCEHCGSLTSLPLDRYLRSQRSNPSFWNCLVVSLLATISHSRHWEHIRGACTEWSEVVSVNSEASPLSVIPRRSLYLSFCHSESVAICLRFLTAPSPVPSLRLGAAPSRSLPWGIEGLRTSARTVLSRIDGRCWKKPTIALFINHVGWAGLSCSALRRGWKTTPIGMSLFYMV